MMLLKKILITFFVLMNFYSSAQNWYDVDSGASYSVRVLFSDSITNKLYVAGQFKYVGDDTLIAYQTASWNGTAWDSLGSGTNCPWSGCETWAITSIERYKGDLFFAGTHMWMDGDPLKKRLSRWDGTQWFGAGNPNGAACVGVANNRLFAMGDFDTISNLPITGIAVWDTISNSWQQFDSPTPYTLYDGMATKVVYYQGDYYFGGNIGGLSSYNEIARWDGTQWLNTPGLNGGMATISDMVVWNNLLVVGGTFLQSEGNLTDYIMAWDGSNWIDLFPTINFTAAVSDLNVIDNELYIVGPHWYAGDTTWYDFARYDGTNFCSFGGQYGDVVRQIEKFNGELYVRTGYNFAGDYYGYIARCNITIPNDTCVSIPFSVFEQQKENHSISVYPNPGKGIFTIENLAKIKKGKLIVSNSFGQEIFSTFISEISMTQIDISNQPNGIYFLRVKSDDTFWTQKIILE